MAELDELPPDQRATLQLLLRQGQGYADIADLLAIDPDAVRDRAHAALDALGPEAGQRLRADLREQISDFLLGQQSPLEAERTREQLASSAAGRAWARGLAGALRPLAGTRLPDIPDAAPEAREEPRRDEPAGYEAFGRPEGRSERPASKLGGALLLGGIALVLAVVVVLLVSGGDDGDDKPERTGSTVSTTAPGRTATNAQGQPEPIAQINLFSTSGNQRTVGLAQIFAMGRRRAIIVAGQGLAQGTYALWLFNSPASARLLGFVPQRVDRQGRFATQGELPADARRFKFLVVTQEQVTRSTQRPPTRPGRVVLRGELKLP